MRLTNNEVQIIKETFKDVFEDGKIYLFGSRIDDSKKGGDIDLYIDIPYHLTISEKLEKKSSFRIKLYDMLGEQKIDIVISKDKNRSIEKEILKTGVLL